MEDNWGSLLACTTCGYHAQLRTVGLLRQCPGEPTNITYARTLSELAHPTRPQVALLRLPVVNRKGYQTISTTDPPAAFAQPACGDELSQNTLATEPLAEELRTFFSELEAECAYFHDQLGIFV